MPYNPKTHLYEVEENIIKDATDSITASKAKANAVNKLVSAFVEKAEETDARKQEAEDAAIAESEAIFSSIGSVISALNTGKMELTEENIDKVNAVEAEIRNRRYYLYSCITLAKDKGRANALIDEYRTLDRQLSALLKGKRKNKL